jgi:group I intron endonuclease
MSIILHAKRIYLSPLSEKWAISLENRGSSGVYALICKASNKFYVGSSVCLANRLLDYMQPAYLAQLVNRPILKALRKYGVNNFIFIVLETCQASVVLEREQYWLDLINPEYNLSPSAGSTLGVTLSEARPEAPRAPRPGPEETKVQISAALKGPQSPLSGIPQSAETINLMRVNHPHTKAILQYSSDKVTQKFYIGSSV